MAITRDGRDGERERKPEKRLISPKYILIIYMCAECERIRHHFEWHREHLMYMPAQIRDPK